MNITMQPMVPHVRFGMNTEPKKHYMLIIPSAPMVNNQTKIDAFVVGLTAFIKEHKLQDDVNISPPENWGVVNFEATKKGFDALKGKYHYVSFFENGEKV